MPEEMIGSVEPATPEAGREPVGAVTEETPVIATTGTEEFSGEVTEHSEFASLPEWAQKEILETRKEAGDTRIALKRFKETFNEWPDEAVDGMLNLAKSIQAGDKAAVPVLQNLLENLSDAEAEAVTDMLAEGNEPEKKFMTPEEVEAYIEQRETKQREESEKTQAEKDALSALETEITALGYDVATRNPDADLLFHFASQQEAPVKDFAAAHKQVEEYKQNLIDGYVKRTLGRNSRFARGPAISGDAPAGVDGGKKNLGVENGNSKKAMEDYLSTLD